MPSYDYICTDCKKHFTLFFTFEEYGKKIVRCTRCGSVRTERRIGRIQTIFGDRPTFNQDYVNDKSSDAADEDPRTMGKMMRKLQEQSGEQMDPEFDEVVGRLEKGDSIESIDRDYSESPLDAE
ncbi:MAG: FmdB family zinc ribbon protein [Flexilinea sp.]|jgi:putative FmdB family regulatory protein